MTTRPDGAPCWADLWTSDVDRSRAFYGQLFGWEAGEANPEFGGYFSFFREGQMIAGGMGDMGEPGGDFFLPANDTWKIYLTTSDIQATFDAAVQAGAQVAGPVMAVADLGVQAVLVDPTGATFGLWQPGTHPGFSTLDEPGAPSWFELHTRDHSRAVDFYGAVFGIEIEAVSDIDEFRYSTINGPADCGQIAGIMDGNVWLPDGVESHWTIYWGVDDVDASSAKVESLGGSVVASAEDTPYGRIATVSDPQGATFRLRTPPV